MKRFVVVAQSRSGSNLLINALRQNPEIRMFGELFHVDEAIRRSSAETTGGAWLKSGADGAAFLEHEIYTERWDAKAVGFKILFGQANLVNFPTVWDHLIADHEIHVVHLFRENALEALVSHEVGLRTGEWFVQKDTAATPALVEPFAITAERCGQFLWHRRAFRRWVTESFSGHAHRIFQYEQDICENFDGTVGTICDFLEVNRHRCEKTLLKQAKRKPKDQLTNYEELKQRFSTTSFAKYFD